MLFEVAKTDEIPEGEARRFSANGLDVAVVNLGGGRFRAVGDVCSHAEASLSEGEIDVDDETVECPRHGSAFDLETGKPLSLPATSPVPAFGVRVDGERIFIEMED